MMSCLNSIFIFLCRNVTSWWINDWSDLPATFPIHDFVLSTGMIKESIRLDNITPRALKVASYTISNGDL